MNEARDLVLKFSKRTDNNNYGDPAYATYRRIESLSSIGRELIDLGYPADAVPLYNEALSDPEALRMVARFYGGGDDNYVARQLREGLNKGLGALNEKNLPQTVRALLKPSTAPAGQAIDLVLLIHPREADHAVVRSLFAESISAATSKPELRSEIKTQIDALLAKHPKDFTVQIAAALVAAREAEARTAGRSGGAARPAGGGIAPRRPLHERPPQRPAARRGRPLARLLARRPRVLAAHLDTGHRQPPGRAMPGGREAAE